MAPLIMIARKAITTHSKGEPKLSGLAGLPLSSSISLVRSIIMAFLSSIASGQSRCFQVIDLFIRLRGKCCIACAPIKRLCRPIEG